MIIYIDKYIYIYIYKKVLIIIIIKYIEDSNYNNKI